MEFEQDRRDFLKHCTKWGVSCFSLFLWHQQIWARTGNEDKIKKLTQPIDLKKRSYCGIACENECQLFQATQENNIELKKEVYEKWNMKEHFNIEFDPDKIFCYSCKPQNKIYKIGMLDCEVRQCAIENEMESCIQCKNLTSCNKKFWEQ